MSIVLDQSWITLNGMVRVLNALELLDDVELAIMYSFIISMRPEDVVWLFDHGNHIGDETDD